MGAAAATIVAVLNAPAALPENRPRSVVCARAKKRGAMRGDIRNTVYDEIEPNL